MRIRDLEARDIPTLREWHARSGFDYTFPDLFNSEFPVCRVLVDEDDAPVMVLAGRKMLEMYMLADAQWRNPRWRLEAFAQLHEDTLKSAKKKGFRTGAAWLPPEIERSFGRKLVNIFGWVKGRWASYSREA